MGEERGRQTDDLPQKESRFRKIARILFIPLVISLVGSLVVAVYMWRATRDQAEITCNLEGWIAIGSIVEAELEELEMTYAGQPVSNVLKVSWRIANTGNKGIERFETPPFITYPEGLTVTQAVVSEKPDLLAIDKYGIIESEERVIKLSNIGILNENDSFQLDVCMLNVAAADVSPQFFEQWSFDAKALDLVTKMELERAGINASTGVQSGTRWTSALVGLLGVTLGGIIAYVSYMLAEIAKAKLGQKRSKEQTEQLSDEEVYTLSRFMTALFRWQDGEADDNEHIVKGAIEALSVDLAEYKVTVRWDAESRRLSLTKGSQPTHERYIDRMQSAEIAYGPDGSSIVRIEIEPSITRDDVISILDRAVRNMLFGK